jgi:hypothetical protein
VFFAFCGACCHSNWKVDIFSDCCLQLCHPILQCST